jgi:hypothetical protein
MRKTKEKGRTLFCANGALKAGDTVGDMGYKRLCGHCYVYHYVTLEKPCDYVFDFTPKDSEDVDSVYADSSSFDAERGCLMQFINSSQGRGGSSSGRAPGGPNVCYEFVESSDRGVGQILIKVLKDIDVGEELLADYEWGHGRPGNVSTPRK